MVFGVALLMFHVDIGQGNAGHTLLLTDNRGGGGGGQVSQHQPD